MTISNFIMHNALYFFVVAIFLVVLIDGVRKGYFNSHGNVIRRIEKPYFYWTIFIALAGALILNGIHLVSGIQLILSQ